MRRDARVVVIGGGVVGCSVLFHLARAGWTDVVLIERSELTSGSSWHAAGGFHTLNGDPNVAKLQAYTVSLYRELEALSGQSCGLHLTGGVMMADSPSGWTSCGWRTPGGAAWGWRRRSSRPRRRRRCSR
jgi:dimethylglycine dehydrogenase